MSNINSEDNKSITHSKKEFQPLIKSTLRDKSVNIKNTMNFDRETGLNAKEDQKTAVINKEELDRKKHTMKTQKMSLDVLLRLDILDPFLRSAENIDHDGKISINEKIDILIDSYLNSKLSTRQLDGFRAIYDTYLNE